MKPRSHIEKPILYLPVRTLIVPCDFQPNAESEVKWIEQTVSLRYKFDDHGRFHSVTKGTYVAREVVAREPVTFFGAPLATR